ncbi:protein FAM221B isoform X2 [Choloepus didactylus]|uniref:protein FAM221B isoform X2 n=1 Tax=Choloepus didactylus TaxID=27675 RepID=UPI00189D83A9|nr:protein FAM221B isoform X2 [Choloepus didactylus]
MEADKVTEETYATMDAEKHPSSKDPSAEDLKEPPVSEIPLEPSVSETPLETHTSESPLEPPISENRLEHSISEAPLETHTSESPLEPLIYETHLEHSISEAPLETHTSESPLEPPISQTRLEHSISQTPLETHTSESPLEPPISQTRLEHSFPQTPLETHTSESPLEPPISETRLEHSFSQTPLETHTSESPLESPISETHLEHSISQTPLEPLTAESPLVPSSSETTLKTHASESPLEPSISETPLEHSIHETPLEAPISEAPVETHISKSPEKYLTFSSSPAEDISVSSSDDLSSESSYNTPLQTRRFTLEDFEYDILQKNSLSGLSTQVLTDTSANQREEAEEDEEGANASGSTVHTSQPGQQLGKKKGKRADSRYTVRPVAPTKQTELVAVAKTMHREQFSPRVNHLFQWEKDAALNAIQTGLHIGWRCPHYLWDCFRIGDESKCFCGHLLREHQIISDISVPCCMGQCRCLMFCFIPSRPEEVGEFWLKRRATFDPQAWRAQCRCQHRHEDHIATGSHPCRHHGCCCSCFESNFLCVACDPRWEEHETFFETEETRRRGGRPYEMSALGQAILSNSDIKALENQRPSGGPSSLPGPPGLPGPYSLQPGPTSDPHI